MINLVLFRANLVDQELTRVFSKAGYHVIETSSAASCSQYLLDEDCSPQEPANFKKLQILLADLGLPAETGWCLSMCHQTLRAPSGVSIALTSLEFAFIKLFALHEVGEPISRKRIVQEFGENYLNYDQNRLDTLVTRLRKKVDHEAQLILPLHTVRVRGFAFNDVLVIDR
jgi:Transcriptional regulatory protein, C terminal